MAQYTLGQDQPLRTDPSDDARAWQRLFRLLEDVLRTMASLASPTAARLRCPTNRSRSAVRGDLIGNRLQNAPSEDLRHDAGVHRLDDHRRCVARVGVHHDIARQQQPAPALLQSNASNRADIGTNLGPHVVRDGERPTH
jgi:hypothetical protein